MKRRYYKGEAYCWKDNLIVLGLFAFVVIIAYCGILFVKKSITRSEIRQEYKNACQEQNREECEWDFYKWLKQNDLTNEYWG